MRVESRLSEPSESFKCHLIYDPHILILQTTLLCQYSMSILTFLIDSGPFSCVSGGADDNLIEGGEMKFVCKPGARNITVIFQPLLRYTECLTSSLK